MFGPFLHTLILSCPCKPAWSSSDIPLARFVTQSSSSKASWEHQLVILFCGYNAAFEFFCEYRPFTLAAGEVYSVYPGEEDLQCTILWLFAKAGSHLTGLHFLKYHLVSNRHNLICASFPPTSYMPARSLLILKTHSLSDCVQERHWDSGVGKRVDIVAEGTLSTLHRCLPVRRFGLHKFGAYAPCTKARIEMWWTTHGCWACWRGRVSWHDCDTPLL